MKYLGTIALSLVLMSSANVAHALDVTNDNTITIGANVYGNADATTSADVSRGTSGNDSTRSENSANSGADVSGNVSTDVNVGIGSVIHITRADVDAGNTEATVSSPGSVQSSSDLSAYTSGLLKADADMGDAKLSGTAVSLAYKQRVKLFGFIPIFVQATATVNADGETTVRYPWYAIFATTDSVSLQSDVKTATAETVSGNAGASAVLSAAAQARLLAQIHDAVKTRLQTSLAAEAAAGASAQ
ncbi:hypothetical protein A3D71_02750 [Candidatus Kaiserbacteria bacterium RIFCSPHIGHO2_02_FULL_55_20]|uniref:Uncharacterized protein n=1 Tax=Candidatus Kaiserbacteria bacterium RIFCSPHIGHO2_02_FULL_55_20 TaxID=1798497 RepID=A0A1F6DYQ8_9BACT|nr:MAG: hypothetical protein A2680_00090 [Candidatus Kaiserbacteria bacterium RIFCSPHIGHO2_01_FULL_55_37]OGG66553.1 MAG: hypothetical protein A3D71_02750 [Candidatus Kaiserbacteria bacterium RIFCSPHIGHO2_02_FULL_55_20]